MLRTTGTGWRCEAAELQYICSKKQVESGKVQRTEILQIAGVNISVRRTLCLNCKVLAINIKGALHLKMHV